MIKLNFGFPKKRISFVKIKLILAKRKTHQKSFFYGLIFWALTAVLPNPTFAQLAEYPFEISYYNFIQYDSNKVDFYGSSARFQSFYQRLDSVVNYGKGQVNIVTIGGSHIQADIFTGQLRKRFQSLNGGQNAGRGYVFPYRFAHTNTPYGYYFRYTGNWISCRNVEKNKICNLGMGGITAITKDSVSSVTLLFEPENDIKYEFNKIKIYHLCDSLAFDIQIDSSLVDSMIEVPEQDYTEFYLNRYVDSLAVFFVKTDSTQTGFELYGMNLETDDPGIIYHNLGINGAATSSFLRCNKMEEQLKSIHPDLVIFGLGINDAYGRRFSQSNYERNYDRLVEIVLHANPNAAIIFTTNNDSYLYRRYVNRNGIKVQESMVRLAKNHDSAVWDMFEIMGGLNSIVYWYKSGLAKKDKIHFTRSGYILMGDLFFDAMMQSFGTYLQTGDVIDEKELNVELTKH